tara:strand:+ start:213 stop:494 length:282 start_codon:yes stop_codon:yes gene_type:complete
LRICRVDRNQPEIVECFRTLGFSVLHVHTLKNCCDIVVSKNKRTACIEIKDGSKPKSARKLTKGEQIFKDNWQGLYFIIESVEDVDGIIKHFT